MPRPHSSLARCILALALSSSLAVSGPASAQDPTTVSAEPTIPDSTLDALRGRQVEVGRSDGSAVAGELLTFDADNLSLIAADGQTVIVPRAEIAAVRVATPSTSPTPAAAPAPVVVTTPNQCLSDNQCEHPTSCVEGACIITQGYLDALEKEGTTRVKAGKWMLIGGAAATGVGAVLFGVGLVRGETLDNQWWDCEDHPDCDTLNRRAGSWYTVSWVGVGVLGLGALALLVGGPTYGVGKGKLRRLGQHKARVAPTAGFSHRGASLGAVVRF